MAGVQPITVPVQVVAALPMAWRHFCGHLNDGVWQDEAVCCGCNMTAKPASVEARYLLAELR